MLDPNLIIHKDKQDESPIIHKDKQDESPIIHKDQHYGSGYDELYDDYP